MIFVGYMQVMARIITKIGDVIETTTPFYERGIPSIGINSPCVRKNICKILYGRLPPISATLSHEADNGIVVYLED